MSTIELRYGPYVVLGSLKHRPEKSRNLTAYLKLKGHQVHLVPTVHTDRFEVVVALRVVFRCRYSNLSELNYKVFGLDHDPVLMRAIEAIEDILSKLKKIGPGIGTKQLYKELFQVDVKFGTGILHNNIGPLLKFEEGEILQSYRANLQYFEQHEVDSLYESFTEDLSSNDDNDDDAPQVCFMINQNVKVSASNSYSSDSLSDPDSSSYGDD